MKLSIAALGAKGIPHPGGIELVMEEIGSRLVKRGHQFDVFVRRHYMTPYPFASYKGLGLPRSPGIHNKYLDALSHSLTALGRILPGPYNLVYFNSIGLSTLAWIPRLAGKKVVVHTHGLDWKREKWGALAKRLLQFSAWTSVRLPHLTFCVCREDQRYLEETFGKPCLYVPNGIPQVDFRPPGEIGRWGLKGDDYLLFMARLVPEKGAHTLLQAWGQIPGEYRQGKKLVIAGDSNHRDAYYQRLMAYQGREDVVFTGFARGRLKAELLSNALCFVQASTLEGMPLSVLEAMGYGRMIVASDIPENNDVLGGLGWSFHAGEVADLADKLAAILQLKPEVLRAEGQKLNKYATATYDWDIIVDQIENRLLELLASET